MAKPTIDLDAALSAARRASEAGRRVLLDYFGQLTRVSEKHKAGLVSEADVESEAVIRKILGDFKSGVRFLGEEGVATDPNQRPENWQ